MAISMLATTPAIGEAFSLPTEEDQLLAVAQHETLSSINFESVAFAVPATVLAMADTFAESLSFGLVGEDDLENYLQENLGEFGQFFNRNRSAVGAVGDVIGAFIPATLAVKGIRSAGFLGKLANKHLGKNAAKYMTSTGRSNQSIFAGQFRKAKSMGMAGVANTKSVRGFNDRTSKLIGRSMGDVLIEGLAADLAIASTMHESEFLFPEEMSLVDNLALFGGFNIAITGAAGMIARRTAKRGIDAAFKSGAQTTESITKLLSRSASSNIIGDRGTAIAIWSKLLDETTRSLDVAKGQGSELATEAGLANKTAIEKRLKDLTEKAFLDSPISGVTNSINLKRIDTGGGEIRTMLKAYARDPNMPVGLRSLEQFSMEDLGTFNANLGRKTVNVEAAFSETAEKLTKTEVQLLKHPNSKKLQLKAARLRDKANNLQKEFDELQQTAPVVVELDGATSVAAERTRIFQDGKRAIIRDATEGTSTVELGEARLIANNLGEVTASPVLAAIKKVDVTGDSQIKLLSDESFLTLPHEQKTAVYDLLQDQAERIEDIAKWEGMQIRSKTPFHQKDFAIEMVKRHGDAAIAKIDGIDTLDDLVLASLNDKFVAYQNLRNSVDAVTGTVYNSLDNVARALNLPTDDALLTFFESLRVANHVQPSLPNIGTLTDLESAMKLHLELPAEATLTGQQYTGQMLNLARDQRPVLAVMRNIDNRAALQAQDLEYMVANQRAQQVEKLRKHPNSVVVKANMAVMDSLQEVIASFKTDLPFLVNGNESQSFFTRGIVQQTHRFRDDETFRAAEFLSRELDLANDKLIENIVKSKLPKSSVAAKSYQEAFNRIVARGHEVELDMAMATRHAAGAGWDLPISPFVQTGKAIDGSAIFSLKLEKTERNKAIWKQMFGEEMPEADSFLPLTGDRQAATVTDRGRDALQAISELSRQAHVEDAAIRNSRSMRSLPKKGFHLPAPNLSAKHREYLIDAQGNMRVVLGEDTKGQLASELDKEIKTAAKNGIKLFRLSEQSVQQYYDARSRAFFEMSDFSRPSNQTGSAKGTAFGTTVKTGSAAFQDMVESILRQYSDFSREVRATIFEPELQYLKVKKDASGETTRTIFDDLTSRLLGVQNLDTDSLIGKSLLAAESLYDENLKFAYDAIIGNLPTSGLAERTASKRFAELNDRIGVEHNPWNSAADYLERTQQVRMPFQLKKHAALLNEVTTAVTIRIFDIGMGVVNMVSLAATMPPVVAMLAQRADESVESWGKRIGAYGVVTPNGNAYFSPAKAVTDGIHFMWSDAGREVAKRAAANGRFDQFAAEQVEIFARSGETFLPGFLRWASKKASIATDYTEREARKWSYMVMYNIGKKGLNLSDDAAEMFAHQQANNTIADFRPGNRPAIFQGAAGMPLGLFTTYMWNYLQRFANIIETSQVGQKLAIGGKQTPFDKAAFVQVGLQASLFGAETLPGWPEFVETFTNNYDGSHSVVDRMNDAFGQQATDLFLNGSVSNLPRLFGMDGISIGPRAAVGLPFKQGLSAQSIAGVRLLTRGAETVGKMIDSSIEEGGFNFTQSAEILAASNMNKGMTNAIELLGTGRALDHTGGVVESNTRTATGIGARLLGFKPLFADELRQENVRNRTTDRIRTELKTRLANNLKSKVRHGNLTSADVESALESYVRAGGNPESFRRFFQSQIVRGSQKKVHREIADAIRNSADQGRIARLLYLSRD